MATFPNGGYDSPAYESPADSPASEVMQAHSGTLDTTGHGSGEPYIAQRPGTTDDVDLGTDTSAAAINEYLRPDLDPLPDGYVAAPVYTDPIY